MKTKKPMIKKIAIAILLLSSIPSFAQDAADEKMEKEQTKKHVNDLISKSAFQFIENKGQYVDVNGKLLNDVFFKGGSKGGDMYITNKGLTYVFSKWDRDLMDGNEEKNHDVDDPKKPIAEFQRMDIEFIGATISKENIIASDTSREHFNYFYAHCPEGIMDVHAFKTVLIRSIYPKIDWVIYCNGEQGVKYDFIVHPGGDPSKIKFAYNGTEGIKISDDGQQLIVKTKLGQVIEGNILSYEQNSGKKINSSYLKSGNEISFDVKDYDANDELIIDPPLVWGTYYGGAELQGVMDMVTTSTDDLFAVGYTTGSIYPTNLLSQFAFMQNTLGGGYDGCIFKFDNWGTKIWTTYYGGTYDDVAWGIAYYNNTIFVTGNTTSANFPMQTGAPLPQQPANAGPINSNMTYHASNTVWGGDAFFLRFGTNGARQYSTFWGGSAHDGARSISVDISGNAFIFGNTFSTNFPTVVPFQAANGGAVGTSDAFLAKFNYASPYTCSISSYHGGTANDFGWSIAADKGGSTIVYAVGETGGGFTPVVNAFQPTYGGGSGLYPTDGFVSKFNCSSAPTVMWSSYHGASGNDIAHSCVYINTPNSRLYVASESSAAGLQTCSTYVYQGGVDIHYQALDVSQTPAVRKYGAYYGTANGDDVPFDLAASQDNYYVYLVGYSTGTGYNPIINDGLGACSYNQSTNQRVTAGTSNGVIMRIFTGATLCTYLDWSSYYGGLDGGSSMGGDFLRCDVVDSHGCLFTGGELKNTAANLGVPTEMFNYGAGTFFDNTFGGTHDQSFSKFCQCGAAYAGPTTILDAPTCGGGPNVTIGPNANSPCFSYSWAPGGQTTATITVAPTTSTNYTLTITGVGGCTSSSVINVYPGCSCCKNSNSSTTNDKKAGIEVFPNPNSGIFSIQLPDDIEKNTELNIMDSFGRSVFELKKTDGNSVIPVDLSRFAKGMYFVELKRPSGEVIVKKVILK